MTGWGSGEWGASFWGIGSGPLRLINAQPIRENVVRLFFNEAMKFTGVLDPNDASDPERYTIVPIAGTLNGDNPRPVTAIVAELAITEQAMGKQIDVTVDRRFSKFPSRYRAVVNQLQTLNGGILDPDFMSFDFDGLSGLRVIRLRDLALPIRDIAKPATRNALFDPLPVTDDPLILGSIPVDENGDYAFDEGITSIKKRIFRRLFTRKGRFAHLPGYGVGLADQSKRLGTQSRRTEIESEAESQLIQEPDIEQVSVTVVPNAQQPGLFTVRVRAKVKVSGDPVNASATFSPTG